MFENIEGIVGSPSLTQKRLRQIATAHCRRAVSVGSPSLTQKRLRQKVVTAIILEIVGSRKPLADSEAIETLFLLPGSDDGVEVESPSLTQKRLRL